LLSAFSNRTGSLDFLDSHISSFGIMRHGKTENIDNEGDSPKDDAT
jgi:hypothetical protein